MPTPIIAIFDIGKTNKKLFLLNEYYQILFEEVKQFPQTTDEDGDACEDVAALTQWITKSTNEILGDKKYQVKALNFSTYGASFVHIDGNGKPVTALYNYLKPFPENLKQQFYKKYGGEITFSMHTASPSLGSLNSGLQLFRLKHQRPEIFKKIKYSLHLPQYASYLVTGEPYSDITSIGCHTGLWNFAQNNYHEWIYREEINEKLAPIFPSDKAIATKWNGVLLSVGAGLHDSSAALIPYLSSFLEPFLLISTGTWCISLNAFNQTPLTIEELQRDCLCYLEYKGNPVKASRLFAGYEHEKQTQRIAKHFNLKDDFFKTVSFDAKMIKSSLKENNLTDNKPQPPLLAQSTFGNKDLSSFSNYREAYHQLILDLIIQQVQSTNLVLHNSNVSRIFVDGGFSKNPVFMNLLAAAFPDKEVYAASVAQATAVGAALAIHSQWSTKAVPSDLIELKFYSANQEIEIR